MQNDFSFLNLQTCFETEPPPLDFVLPGMLAGTVGGLVSAGGAGKTMLAMQMSVAVATGVDSLNFSALDSDFRLKSGKVLFLTAEDPAPILHKRFHSIGKKLSRIQRELAINNMIIAPLVGRSPDLMQRKWQDWIESHADGARLIVIDTLRRFHLCDENDGGAMAQVLAVLERLCQSTGASTLFLHHASKTGAMNAANSQQASRGSSVLTDNIRFQANLATMAKEAAEKQGVDERKKYVCLSYPKLNYSAPINDVWLRRGEGGILEPVQIAAQQSKKKVRTEVSKAVGDEVFN